jgi:AraC-like DNA-binding protein
MFRAIKIRRYLRAMQQLGIGADRLLAKSNINQKEVVSNPNYLIGAEQYHTVVANMMRLTGNPGVAFLLQDTINIADIGILGYAMLSASSLRQATQVWMECSNSLYIGTAINIESCQDASPGYQMTITSPPKAGILHRFETEELLVQGQKLVEVLTGKPPVVGKITLAYPKPKHYAVYEEFFKCALEFDAPRTTLRVLQPDPDIPIQTWNEELFLLCTLQCRKVMRSIPGDSVLRGQLRNLFLTTPGNLPDLNEASALLSMSVATLRRKLKAHRQSYQAIKDEFRFDLAREYLQSGQLSPKQVAYLLGFTTPSDFSRAFKSWSGQTVKEFLMSDGIQSSPLGDI